MIAALLERARSRTRRLATHEDGRFMHAHKLLGVAVLASFAMRLWTCATGRGGTGLDDGSWATLAWIGVHAALHVTSFQFALPARRNLAYNTIWPEMRWHSLAFAWRSVAVLALFWLHRNGLLGETGLAVGRAAAVMATMVAADVATWCHRGGPTAATATTMRGNPFPEGTPVWLRRATNAFYSTSQITGTLALLFRDEGAAFWLLLPLQIAPLLMTLEKKGFVSKTSWHVWYTATLLVNYVYTGSQLGPFARMPSLAPLAAAIVALRFFARVDKYLLWGAVIACFCGVGPSGGTLAEGLVGFYHRNR